jgi:hypothetical protein
MLGRTRGFITRANGTTKVREQNGWGYNWATLFLGGYKYRDLALQVGEVSKIGTIKYGHDSRWTQTREILRWRGPATAEHYRTDPLSERAPHINKPITV